MDVFFPCPCNHNWILKSDELGNDFRSINERRMDGGEYLACIVVVGVTMSRRCPCQRRVEEQEEPESSKKELLRLWQLHHFILLGFMT